MGSGKLLTAAFLKYGKENFKKEILEMFDNENDMVKREIEIVTEDFIKSGRSYNIMPGGRFGSKEKNGLTFKGRKHSEITKEKMKISNLRTITDETRKKLKENNWARKDPVRQREHAVKAGQAAAAARKNSPFSEEIKKKVSKSLKDYYKTHISANKGLKREKVKCPYCDKVGALNTMSRWHFNNCKRSRGETVSCMSSKHR
jgi:hypothetical protein